MTPRIRKPFYTKYNQLSHPKSPRTQAVEASIRRRLHRLFKDLRAAGLTWLEVEYAITSRVHDEAVFYRLTKTGEYKRKGTLPTRKVRRKVWSRTRAARVTQIDAGV